MKYIAVITMTFLVILSAAGEAFGQEEEQWSRYPYNFLVSLDGGMGVPIQPGIFKDNWNESLPFTAAFGYVVIPWVEVYGFFSYASSGISENTAKDQMRYIGPEAFDGGSIRTMMYGGIGKLIILPNSRLTPFLEAGAGMFRATAKNLEVINGGIDNSMESVGGPLVISGLGVEHNINETWNVYAKFNWVVGLNSDFNPGMLLLNRNDPPTIGDDLHLGMILLGIKLKM